MYRSALKNAAFESRQYRMLAGRTGVIAGIAVFITGYVYGLIVYGPLLGIALGWLPCSIAAWLTATLIASLVSHIAPWFISTENSMSPVARSVLSGIHHKH